MTKEIEEAVILVGCLFILQPLQPQPQQFTVTANFDRIAAHPMDPGVANLFGHHRQRSFLWPYTGRFWPCVA